jgi:gamma-glutamyltranspeptidase / glutathione hydrolase
MSLLRGPRLRATRLAWALLLAVIVLPVAAAPPRLGAIASAHPLATAAGFEILEAGGNAVDAAVAVAAALAVVEPTSSGLGGGAFFLLSLRDRREVFVDARETAPAAATADMYLGPDGKVRREASLDGPRAAGIPGEPAALAHLAERYGRLPLAQSLAPAIRLARDGYVPDAHHLFMTKLRVAALKASPEAARLFLVDGAPPPPGWKLIQEDLARVLERLAAQGAQGFYAGPTAQALLDGVQAAGGIWRAEDLAGYRVVERAPLRARYGDVEVLTAPPPSGGGIGLITALNVLEDYPLQKLDPAVRVHLAVEALRRVYRDRVAYLGDPDFVAMPLEQLASDAYAAGLRAGIRLDRATPSALLPGAPAATEGTDTTHFSAVDTAGNVVAATLSINIPFGSGFVAPGTGVLLNDEMDDFAAAVGASNVYGLYGSPPNAIAPGKRPLSSMTPTVLRRGSKVGVLGTPGGSRIVSMVLLGTLAFAEQPDDPQAWVSRPRYHHQFLPDVIEHEPGTLGGALAQALRAMGHTLKDAGRAYGNMQAVAWDSATQTMRAASDPRREGAADVR